VEVALEEVIMVERRGRKEREERAVQFWKVRVGLSLRPVEPEEMCSRAEKAVKEERLGQFTQVMDISRSRGSPWEDTNPEVSNAGKWARETRLGQLVHVTEREAALQWVVKAGKRARLVREGQLVQDRVREEAREVRLGKTPNSSRWGHSSQEMERVDWIEKAEGLKMPEIVQHCGGVKGGGGG